MSTAPNQPVADALVLFGATGDLSKRKLFPALYRLEEHGHLKVPVVGVARSDWSDEGFRQHAHDSILASIPDAKAAVIDALLARLDLVQGDYADPTTWSTLAETLRKYKSEQAVFYMAIPPSIFPSVAQSVASVHVPGHSVQAVTSERVEQSARRFRLAATRSNHRCHHRGSPPPHPGVHRFQVEMFEGSRQLGATRSGLQPGARTNEERVVEHLSKPRQRPAHRWLRKAEAPARERDAPLGPERLERQKQVQVHRKEARVDRAPQGAAGASVGRAGLKSSVNTRRRPCMFRVASTGTASQGSNSEMPRLSVCTSQGSSTVT